MRTHMCASIVAAVAIVILAVTPPVAVRASGPSHDTLAHDEHVLREIYSALNGRTRWPQPWREHWKEVDPHQPTTTTAAAPPVPPPPSPAGSDATTNTTTAAPVAPVPSPQVFTSCVPASEWRGATCQLTLRRIIRLCHRSGVAQGVLPPSMATMTRLELIDWSENALTGPLPPFGERNEHLASIAFAGNAMTGPIPPSLGRLVQLRVLSLSRNRFSGPIPAELGDAIHLEALMLDGNPDLTGEVPWQRGLFRLKKLRHLRLDGNPGLTSTVRASEIHAAFPEMLALELAGSTGIRLIWDDAGKLARSLHLLTVPSDPYIAGGRRQAHMTPTAEVDTAIANAGHRATAFVPRGDMNAPLRFMAMGDFGTGGQMLTASRELASATHFNRTAEWVDSQFTITVGDNLYVPKWLPVEAFFHESFELLYGASRELARPWFAGMGNHDNPSEVKYAAREKKWRMNVTEYAHRVSVLDGDAADEGVWGPTTTASHTRAPHLDLFVHDSVSKLGAYNGLHWKATDEALKRSDARFKVSTAHYPPMSSGCHKTHSLAKAWHALGRFHNITAFFAGHDHHSEALFDPTKGIYHFLVGGFARGPCAPHNHRHSLFKEPLLGGFTYVAVGPTLLNVTYVSEVGHIQFKVVVPHDWARRGMGRLPTADEITGYVREAEAFGQTSASGSAAATEPPPAAAVPTATSTTTAAPATVTAGHSPTPLTTGAPTLLAAGDASTSAITGAPAASIAPTTTVAAAAPATTTAVASASSVRRSGFDVYSTHGKHGVVASMARRGGGGTLWWVTAVVCVVAPLVVMGAVLHDWRQAADALVPPPADV